MSRNLRPHAAGSIEGSFEALHDYRGRNRSITAAGGLVAADHGRCSDIGEGSISVGSERRAM